MTASYFDVAITFPVLVTPPSDGAAAARPQPLPGSALAMGVNVMFSPLRIGLTQRDYAVVTTIAFLNVAEVPVLPMDVLHTTLQPFLRSWHYSGLDGADSAEGSAGDSSGSDSDGDAGHAESKVDDSAPQVSPPAAPEADVAWMTVTMVMDELTVHLLHGEIGYEAHEIDAYFREWQRSEDDGVQEAALSTAFAKYYNHKLVASSVASFSVRDFHTAVRLGSVGTAVYTRMGSVAVDDRRPDCKCVGVLPLCVVCSLAPHTPPWSQLCVACTTTCAAWCTLTNPTTSRAPGSWRTRCSFSTKLSARGPRRWRLVATAPRQAPAQATPRGPTGGPLPAPTVARAPTPEPTPEPTPTTTCGSCSRSKPGCTRVW